MLDEVLIDFYCNTKLSDSSDIAKSEPLGFAAWLVQELFVVQNIIKVKIYSVAEFVKQDMQMKTKANKMKCK